MIHAAFLSLAVLVAQPGGGGGGGALQLRGQVAPLSGEIASVSFGGVVLKTSPDDPGRLYSWDRVRSVDGAGEQANAGAFIPYADALMRGRARLERGDTWLADQAIEPLYQQAVAAAGGSAERFVGPSGLLLAECALRTNLDRSAAASATLAWLQWSAVDRLRPRAIGGGGTSGDVRAPQWIGGTVGLAPVIDPSTGLCPKLPPIFPRQGPSSAGMLRVLTQSPQLKRLCADASLSRGLAVPYAIAARIASGEELAVDAGTFPAPTNESEQLVSDIVAAQAAPNELMRSARARLMRRLEQIQRDADTRENAEESEAQADRSWLRPWLHAAIGRSLLNEDQASLRKQGLVELLHVPALDGATQPTLSATALLDVIEYLRRDGEGAGMDGAIAALTSELRQRFGVDPTPVPAEPASPSTTPGAPEQYPLIAPPPVAPGGSATPTTTPPSKEAP